MDIRQQFVDLYNDDTNYQIIGRSKLWGFITLGIVLVSSLSFFVFGLNQSIEFTGGTSFDLPVEGRTPDTGEVRELLRAEGISDLRIQIVNDDSLRISSEKLDVEQQNAAIEVLSEYANIESSEISISDVGPSWGKQVTREAITALLVFLLLVSIYMIFRFEWPMAIAAIVAVLHDIVITVGIYAIAQFVVSPATVIAVLTILGFSLYDSVVVFDKISDNTKLWEKLRQGTYAEVVNASLNQVLMRSINTTITSILPVISLILVGSFFLNAVALLDFAIALLIGLIAGTYSSIFVAAPLLVAIKKRTKKADKM